MYSNFGEIIDLSIKSKKELYEIILEWEMLENGQDQDDLVSFTEKIFEEMLDSYKAKLDNDELSLTGWSGFNTKKYKDHKDSGKSIMNKLFSKSLLAALSTSENNANMGKIVACPTAGSAGVVPGVLISLYEEKNIPKEKIVQSLVIAGAIGEFISKKSTLSGAAGGCQAEIGSACSMAAGAAVNALGGSAKQVENASALALKFLMGLVCDPVGGFVEVPCIKRNPAASILALTAAEMALSGIESVIPFDEVAQAMAKVGRSMSEDLRETGKGGIAASKTAKKILSRFTQSQI
ncbi:MAG: L-serine ammonia-lyase, iron-sulfur-dependent, subunit alpha [Thermotogota bacterium]